MPALPALRGLRAACPEKRLERFEKTEVKVRRIRWGLVVSDPVNLDVDALSDLAVSIYLPQPSAATTMHLLALQTSYIAAGNASADVRSRTGRGFAPVQVKRMVG